MKATNIPPQPQPQAQSQVVAPTQPVRTVPTSEVNGTDMRPGYDASLVLSREGEELSFEEVRAMSQRYVYKKSSLRETLLASSTSSNVIVPSNFIIHPDVSPSQTTKLNHGGLHESPRHPSPTMCTRAAMNDIDAMFKDSPLTVPFSARSLTTEIPTMDPAGVVLDLNQRGRPSPVAFTVFTDEELLTRNIAQSASAAERDAANASFAAKAYPPLTPILEMSHESDMSHVSNTSMAAPTPAQPTQQQQQAEGESQTINPDNIVDPFDAAQREQWISELGVLTSDGVNDLSSESCPADLDALANGTETSIELGDKLFQVTSVLSYVGTEPNEKVLTLTAENLLDGGEVCLRFASRHSVLEQTFAQSFLSRVVASSAGGEGGVPADVQEVEQHMKTLFYTTQESFVYQDRCVSIGQVSNSGNLRQLLGMYTKNGLKMDERLVAFYCYELLKLIQLLHTHSYLHNTLTPDSIWLRFEEDDAANSQQQEWSEIWSPSGEGGWSRKGLSLGEFTSGIDKTLFPTEAMFRCENTSSAAMASNPLIKFAQDALGLPAWTEQLDLLSIAGVAHAMLFGGGDMDCVLDESTGTIQLVQTLTSEFSQTTFAPVFETILNFRPTHPSTVQQESLELIQLLLQHFEMALAMEVNGHTVATQIKTLLCKQQMMMIQNK